MKSNSLLSKILFYTFSRHENFPPDVTLIDYSINRTFQTPKLHLFPNAPGKLRNDEFILGSFMHFLSNYEARVIIALGICC